MTFILVLLWPRAPSCDILLSKWLLIRVWSKTFIIIIISFRILILLSSRTFFTRFLKSDFKESKMFMWHFYDTPIPIWCHVLLEWPKKVHIVKKFRENAKLFSRLTLFFCLAMHLKYLRSVLFSYKNKMTFSRNKKWNSFKNFLI